MTKKLTKKMLAPLETSEIRKIVICGLKMEPLEAYTKKQAPMLSWIQEKSSDFANMDISDIEPESFRPNVESYLKRLQKFLLGELKTAPTFPKDSGEEAVEEVEDVVEEAVEEAVEVVEPPKRKRGRPRKNPVAEEAVTEEATEEAPPKRKRGRPRKHPIAQGSDAVKPKRKRGRPRKDASTEAVARPTTAKKKSYRVKSTGDTPPVALVKEEITPSTPEVTLNVATDLNAFLSNQLGVQEELTELRAQVSALRTEQTEMFNLINNCLVYMINTVIIDEGENMIKDLTSIPNPDKYVK